MEKLLAQKMTGEGQHELLLVQGPGRGKQLSSLFRGSVGKPIEAPFLRGVGKEGIAQELESWLELGSKLFLILQGVSLQELGDDAFDRLHGVPI